MPILIQKNAVYTGSRVRTSSEMDNGLKKFLCTKSTDNSDYRDFNLRQHENPGGQDQGNSAHIWLNPLFNSGDIATHNDCVRAIGSISTIFSDRQPPIISPPWLPIRCAMETVLEFQ